MPLPREVRKKLAALPRTPDCAEAVAPEPASPTPAKAEATSPAPFSDRARDRLRSRIRARREPVPGPAEEESGAFREECPTPELAGPPLAIEDLFPGEVRRSPLGLCYAMQAGTREHESLALALRGFAADREDALPTGALAFLDIETAGLSSMPVFLVGILRWSEGSLSLVQILARDYPEEAALLGETVLALRGCSRLFTFNGASFDLPYLTDRAVYHAVDFRVEPEHCDLLPPARRRFRRRLPDCRLQTLERHVCGRLRHDDIASAEIPQRYRDFVRSGDARLLEVVIRHNRLDLLTLAELLPHCLGEGRD